jgi:tetratricopeptide (TPR) repeat protein
MDDILDHEERFWRRHGHYETDASADTWTIIRARQLIVAATLLGGFPTQEEAKRISTNILGESPRDEDLIQLNRIYGVNESDSPPYIDSLQPDLLGEAMVLRLIRAKSKRSTDYVTRVFDQAPKVQLQRGFEILGRIGTDNQEEAKPWIRDLLKQDLSLRTVSAFLAARNVATRTAFSPLADVIQELLERENMVELAPVLESLGIPDTTVSMRKLAAWVNNTLVVMQSQEGTGRDQEHVLAERARRLNNLCVSLSELGRREEALASAEEAAGIYRRLSEKNPDAFLPDLAMSLNNLGNRLSELGRREEALASAEEALDIYWPFFEKFPQAFARNTGIVLINVQRLLTKLGHQPSLQFQGCLSRFATLFGSKGK